MGERIAIVGSRGYPVLARVRAYVDALPADTVIVSGGARGVDNTAAAAAMTRGLQIVMHRPAWTDAEGHYDRGAGFRRNAQIVADADRLVAFWDGESRGTAHSIGLAIKAHKPVEVVLGDGSRLSDADVSFLFLDRRVRVKGVSP